MTGCYSNRVSLFGALIAWRTAAGASARLVRVVCGSSLAGRCVPSSSAASAGAPARPFRAVIVGDGDFASNSFFPYMSNSELALSMVRWLAREDRAPRIRAGVPLPPLILLTGQQMKTIFLLLEILLPLGVIAVGTVVWWRRR